MTVPICGVGKAATGRSNGYFMTREPRAVMSSPASTNLRNSSAKEGSQRRSALKTPRLASLSPLNTPKHSYTTTPTHRGYSKKEVELAGSIRRADDHDELMDYYDQITERSSNRRPATATGSSSTSPASTARSTTASRSARSVSTSVTRWGFFTKTRSSTGTSTPRLRESREFRVTRITLLD